MDYPNDGVPIYVSDHELVGSDSESTLFGTESMSSYSMSTLNSGEAADYFRFVHGLPYSNDENIPLFLPAALTTAIQIRVMFHTVVRLSQDGLNAPPEVDDVLRAGGLNGQKSGARVLDLFTNDGTWVQEMAEMYPTASFVSVDVKPFSPHQPHQNITFEVYDLYAGIAEPDSSFDIVNAIQCINETKDFNFLLREMHRVLKPNGVLVITEIPFWSYEVENPSVVQGLESRHALGLDWLRRAFQAQGVDITVERDMSARLSPGHPLWAERSINPEAGVFEPQNTPNSVRGFQSINMRTRLVPTGPWPEDKAQRIIGSVAYLLITHSWKFCGPILLMLGMEEGEIQAMADAVATELAEGQVKGYLKCHRWTARKI